MNLQVLRDAADPTRTTLAVTGFVDISNSAMLVEAGLDALSGSGSLALDLAEVDFMDSTGISALVELALEAQRGGVEFEIGAASAQVRRVLELTGLADRWSLA